MQRVEPIQDDRSERKARKSAYVWNTIGGLLMAFQSVIMLIVITRVSDLVTAGVFSIAYATANLFLNMGKYGMRNFQVSDVVPSFSFKTYRASRAVTGAAMVICSVAYLTWSALTLGYALEKTVSILLMCAFKLVDAFEDVYYGNFQQNGRLDVAGRLMTARLVSTIIVFATCIVGFGNLSSALLVSTAYTALFFCGALLYAKRRFALPVDTGGFDKRAMLYLLKDCLPLFLAAFLLFYIGNAPKYAIDAIMGDTAQAVYGFIAMPVFVVSLFASFVYAPIIAPLSALWVRGDVPGFRKTFFAQVAAIFGIAAACTVLAWFFGVPVLNLLYNTDVSAYLVELCVLVAGGGFLALVTLFTVGITIIRYQKELVWGYIAVSVLAFFGSAFAVSSGGIAGAAWTYFAMMGILVLWFGITFAVCAKVGSLRMAASRTRSARPSDNELFPDK